MKVGAAWAVREWGPGVNRLPSFGPTSSGMAARRLKPPVSRPYSAAATMQAASAPAD